jgi:hypothetical protein
MHCNCTLFTDIRNRCSFTYNPRSWAECPVKVDTILWHILNDNDMMRRINASGGFLVCNGISANIIVVEYAKKYKLNKDNFQKLIECYNDHINKLDTNDYNYN